MRGVAVACLAAALAAGGCARPPGGDRVESACEPVTYGMAAGTTAASMAGSYAITLVATGGDSTGRTATGRLDLARTGRQDAALVGKTDVPVAAVGALRLGRLASAADSAPGVLVMQGGSAERPTILLRLGSDANAAETIRFDGGYTVLEVLQVDGGGFAGSWRSGVEANSAVGHFCAERVTDQIS